MLLRHSVSIIALAAASLSAEGAGAQTANIAPTSANVLNLLSPFLSLNATPTGRAALQSNLDQAVFYNNTATLRQQQLAISDKNLLGSATNTLSSVGLGTYGAGANLAGGLTAQTVINGVTPQQPVGGLGPVLGPIYVAGSAAGTSGPLGNVVNLLARAYTFTGNDLGVAKNYFANGAATNPSTTPAGYVPIPAVAPAGTSVPTFNGLPNTRDSVYDLAYGVTNTQPGQNVYGSSRPLQVAQSRYTIFDPTALNGIATNPSFPSGHATYGFTDGTLLAMTTPQAYQSMVLRASEYGESRIVLGVHYPLDIIGGRALSYYELAQAFTNPLYINNATTTGTAIDLPSLYNQAYGQMQSYLSAQCGASVAACAASAANTANNPYVPSAASQTLYQQRQTFGLPTLTFAQAPREAAPAGGPDASILLAPLYGGSTSAAQTIAPNGGLYGTLQTGTINQIVVNTESNAIAALYGTPLSYWSRVDLYAAAGYFGNVIGALQMASSDRLTTDVTVGNTGALYANGTITGRVTVGSGGLLGGTGTVGGVVAQSGGTVAPGNSIGTLTVAGNASFAAGSTFQVETNAAGQSDRLAATGSATLQGGTVQVLAQNGAYTPRTQYAILSANAGVTGTFAGVSSNLAFLTPTLRYQPTEVDLTLTRNDIPFATIARTRNQAAVATAIQGAGAGAGIYDRTVGLTTPEAITAFQALTGDIHASSVSAAYETAFFVREAILDRLRWSGDGTRDYGRPPATFTADLPGRAAPVAPVPVRVLDPRVFGLWGQGFGSFGQARGDGGAIAHGNAVTLNRDTAGFVLGADLRLENGIRLGVAGGYTTTNLDTPSRTASGTIESGFGGVYGGYEAGPFALRLGAVYADNSLRLRRSVVFPGLSETEASRYGGATVQGFGEIGYRFVFGSTPGIVSKDPLAPVVPASVSYIEPFVGGAYVGIDRDRFAETGGVAALSGASWFSEIPTLTVGVRGQTEVDLGFGAPVSLHGLVGYRRAFGDVIPTALLAYGSGPSFVTAGIPITRDALIASAGVDLRVSAAATLGVSYTGQVGSRAEDHAVKGTFTYRF
ncbi:autotransporter domain-containing protein [Methylobacterium nonmethylotrophicum]|uniref:Autotransporter domain-containing protein n=1 Tax=Methylobacterium nonmethylotrophicum TaxID=1141884 RepID=A0A4Z0NWZ2_9HYPH|nr:autotransporter domain-containing protein [Methylobacterium nonmethylotrophicum]TGE01844.1 autotransporter domain-containing protein [Methylobacterium nonmethylotrophicum]